MISVMSPHAQGIPADADDDDSDDERPLTDFKKNFVSAQVVRNNIVKMSPRVEGFPSDSESISEFAVEKVEMVDQNEVKITTRSVVGAKGKGLVDVVQDTPEDADSSSSRS
jgi:hypothetical protein